MIKTGMCMLLLFCISAFAQTGMDSGTHKQMAGKKTTMTGCVMEKDGQMMLMDKKHPNGVMLTGSEDMKAHNGHTVKVAGTMTKMGGADSSKMAAGGDKAKTDGPMLNVDSVTMVKDSCDMGAKKDKDEMKK